MKKPMNRALVAALAAAGVTLLGAACTDQQQQDMSRVDDTTEPSRPAYDTTPTEEPTNAPEAPGQMGSTSGMDSPSSGDAMSSRMNINTMSKDEFVSLGLSEPLAERITQQREQTGEFETIDELRNIPGMDVAWLNRNRDRLSAESVG